MILRPRPEVAPAPFAQETLHRLPLADAVLSVWRYLTPPDFLAAIFDRYRGRSFEDTLSFATLVQVLADALTRCHGSGRRAFQQAHQAGQLPTAQRAVYGKLARVPLPLALGLFHALTARLQELLPAGLSHTPLPPSLGGLEVVIVDGKKIKRVAKRLLAVRGRPGKVYGGKLLVGYLPRLGLAVAVAADPDGEANDIRLVPDWLPQARAAVPGPRLWVADRQFCDLEQPARFADEGDHYLIRFRAKIVFQPDPTRPAQTGSAASGRAFREEWGWLGAERQGARRRYVRRIRLDRGEQEAILLITDLLDASRYPAADLLAVYLARWGIENVFQQITEVFGLEHLIGCTPQATVFQACLCLVLYNLVQLVRAYVAVGRPTPVAVTTLSAEKLFTTVQEQLVSLFTLLTPVEVQDCFPRVLTSAELVAQLRELLSRAWSPEWVKTVNQKPRPQRPKARQSGAHTSVHKVLQAARQQPRAKDPEPSG